jgi:regulator of replication initiation timing
MDAVSNTVQQALGKLNVRMADLMEQINSVIKVLVDENTELRLKLDSMQLQQQKNAVRK